MSDSKNKRYPGARPFKDSPLERKLFFGRKDEKKKLLNDVLSNKIVVLFAKSGVGKSSLLNAGVFEQLIKKGYFPISIRLNTPSERILDSIELQIGALTREKNVEFISKNKDSLWEFLKTSEFWTEDDTLMTPVLVFDQFEEIFTLEYTDEQRQDFFKQLAELRKDKRKRTQNEGDDKPKYRLVSAPKVKIVLSLREEFLAQLEEISVDIPSILWNRFRLTELTEEQAIDAIERPAELYDENLSSRNFVYSEGAIKAVTKFLMKKDVRERLKIMTKTWDTKWPKWIMLIFATLLILLTLLVNYLGQDLGELFFNVVVWLVIPVFTFILAIRNPIAGRNTIVPVLLLYAWFYLLTLVANRSIYYEKVELFLLVLTPTIFTLVVVLLICASYRKGRNEVLSHSAPMATETNISLKKWPRKPYLLFLVWLIISSILSGFLDIAELVVSVNILVTLIYFLVLAIKFPVPPKKSILPVVSAYFLIALSIVFTVFLTPLDIIISDFIILLILSLITWLLVASLWLSYRKGLKSVDPQHLESLGKSKEKIEPFQLQLLCQNIEEKVLIKQRKKNSDKILTITKKDFGGEIGMRRILGKFYDDQLNKVNWTMRGKVRKLCERGLISPSGRRLSIAEDDIINRFKVKKGTLAALIDHRLLRAEPRLGSKYYEISHDTLIQPILTSATKNINREQVLKWVGFTLGLILLVFGINFYEGLTNPTNAVINQQMDAQLESGSVTHKEKITRLESHIDKLTQRDRFQWLIMNNENKNDTFNDDFDRMLTDAEYNNTYDLDYLAGDIQYNKNYYRVVLDSLRSIDSLLTKYKNLRLVDSEKKEVNDYSITLDTNPKEISISLLADSDNVGFHNLEIEWHFKQEYDSDFQLLQKIKMDSVSGKSREIITKSFALSETLCEGFNILKFYELDPANPSRRYLLEIREFNVTLRDIQYYQEKLKEEPENPKYNAHLGFTYYRRGQSQEALKYLNKALENDSKYALAYYWRGHVQNSPEKKWSDYLQSYLKDWRLRSALKIILRGSVNRISNGSFEFPELPDNNYLLTSELGRESIDTLNTPSWENEDGINFDLKSFKLGQGDAKEGKQFIELSGKSNSWIRQKVITETDTEYVLSFAFSARPGRVREDNRMEISWNGVALDTVESDGLNYSNTRWRTYYFPVKATGNTSYIKFRDIGDSTGHNVGTGPYLDAVFLVRRQDYGNIN